MANKFISTKQWIVLCRPKRIWFFFILSKDTFKLLDISEKLLVQSCTLDVNENLGETPWLRELLSQKN